VALLIRSEAGLGGNLSDHTTEVGGVAELVCPG